MFKEKDSQIKELSATLNDSGCQVQEIAVKASDGASRLRKIRNGGYYIALDDDDADLSADTLYLEGVSK